MAVSVDLIDALKRCLRAQNLTYRELAARIRMSEAAVKRMFSRRAMSLQRLEQINNEATTLHDLLRGSHNFQDPEMRRALANIGNRIAQMRGEWERPPHKPVLQQSMDAGSVELF